METPEKTYLGEHGHRFDSIFVIEALQPPDRRTGLDLYDAVLQPLAAAHDWLEISYTPVANTDEFCSQLADIATSLLGRGRCPVLHIESHGSNEGILIGKDDRLPWPDLKVPLRAVNIASEFSLMVVVAACSGGHLVETLNPLESAPVWGILGPEQSLLPGELESGYGRFYNQLFETGDALGAMEALNQAPFGEERLFMFRSASMMFRTIWSQYFRTFGRPEVLDGYEDQVVKHFLAQANRPDITEAEVRRIVKGHLPHLSEFFEERRRAFFMCDLFPHNERRFPIGFDEVAAG